MSIKSLLAILFAIILTSCVEEQASEVSPVQGEITNPDFIGLGLNIKTPIENSTVLKQFIISGRCSNKNYPIQITSAALNKTIYSICQENFTWAAAISSENFSQGNFKIQAQIFDQAFQTSSPLEEINLTKGENLCTNENASDLFGNFKTNGNGTTVPYLICNPDQFANIRFYPSSSFVLGQDIDFSNRVISPIGIPFKGTINGQGFHLSNFIIKDLTGNQTSVGLFKYVQDANFLNLNIKGAVVEGYQRVGIIAGDWRGSGSLNNTKVQGRVNGVTYIGGIFGLANTSSNLDFQNTEVEVEVVGTNYTGGIGGFIVSQDGILNISNTNILSKTSGNDYISGIIGRSLTPNITFNNVQRVGDITSNGKFIGGFVGQAPGITVTDSLNVGNLSSTIDAEDVCIGGIAGFLKGHADITNSSSTTNISSGGHYTGGLLGKVNSATITNSYTRGSITIQDDFYDSVTKFAGGLIGGNGLDSTIIDSRSFMNFNVKTQFVGGLVGVMNGENSKIQNSYYKGNLSAYTSHIGGLAGIFNGNLIDKSFSQPEITVNNPTPNAYIGGIAGQTINPSTNLNRVYTKGNINISNGLADNVGGIVGFSFGGSINEAFFKGDITGARSKIGGIAGYSRSNISKSYTETNILANFRYVGGIAGIVQNAAIEDSFSISNLQGAGEVGGIIGWHLTSSDSINQVYHLGNITKLEASIFPNSTFSEILGLTSDGTINNAFHLSTNQILDHNGSLLTGTGNTGVSLTSSQLRNEIYYTGFTFNLSSWSLPTTGFKLPFNSNDFLFATQAWLKEANQGFVIPEIFSSNPLERVYPSIFVEDIDVLSNLDQEQLAIINSSTPLETVSINNLEISIEEPVSNGLIVNGKKLIYGECGIVGYPILISGSITLKSICQSNNRWAAIIDVAGLPIGNVNIIVQMQNPSNSSFSNSVTRTLIKSNDLCEQREAIAGTFANSFQGADGITIPFKICHSGHFSNIAYYPNAKFEIVNDIDFGGNTINPIQSVFTGSINGNGHTIRNFVIDKKSSIGVGIFRIVNNATIRNLSIENASVTGYERVGILAGSSSETGLFENLNVKGEVNGILYTGGVIGLANTSVDLTMNQIETEITVQGNSYTGGVLGHISTLGGNFSITDGTFKNNVNGLKNVGGVVGSTLDPNFTMTNISQSGNISGIKENIGGVVGHARGGTFSNITMLGDITANQMAEEVNAGGLFGLMELTTFNLNTATYNGTITAGADNVGGIVGKLIQGTMTNLQSQGTINLYDTKFNSVRSYVGGLIGNISESSNLTNSFSTVDINSKARFVGGLVGRFHGENSVLTNSHFSGEIDATTSFIGGVAGFFFGEDFNNNYSNANLNITNPTPNSYIGGLVGYANSWTSNYQKVYATGDINISNGIADYVGGLVGYFRGGSLSECYATGNITGGRSAIGGLVGLHRGSTQYCFASGNVDANFRHAGGLIGYLLNGSISDSFSLGDVSASAQSGGLLGFSNTTENQIQNVYALGSISRKTGSTNPLNEFGPIVGLELTDGSITTSTSYSLDTNQIAGHNTKSSQLILSQFSEASNFIGYDFISEKAWRMPTAGYSIPGGSDYHYPIHEWLGSGSVVESFSLAGNISGLNFGSIQLDLNGVEQIIINQGQTNYNFSTLLTSGSPYTITLSAQPGFESIDCNISNAIGFVGTQNISNIDISCTSLDSISLSQSNFVLGIGETLQLNVNGQLSNNVSIDVTDHVSWNSLDSATATVSSSGLVTGVRSASATIQAQLVGLTANANISVFNSINPANSLSWTHSSPHNQLNLEASWTPSNSTDLIGQTISIFNSADCSGNIEINSNLLPSVSTYSFTGNNLQNYSYIINTTSYEGVQALSSCSSAMAINLDTPDPVTNIASGSVWINGNAPLNSPTVTWTNPINPNMTNIMVGLGSSFGNDDIVNFSPIGINTFHVFPNLNLTECSPYFPSIKVQDQYGLESEVATDTIGFRWDNTPPNIINEINLSGDATETSSPQTSWTNPGDNCALRYYEIGIGTTSSSPDVTGYRPIGNITSYTAVSGLNGFNLNLTKGQDYFTFVRSVDYANNKSDPQISASWQVIDLQTSLPSLILWLDSTDKTSIEDDSNYNANDPLFDGRINEWIDISQSSTQHNFRSIASDNEPYFSNDTLFFNGANHFMTATNHAEINLTTLSEKNISFAFRTENDINNTQVIYEEGGTVRGMNIYISGGRLYCGFWNVTDDGDGAQPFVSVSSPISRNKTYSVSWVLDYSNYTGPTGADGNLECFLNNNSIGSTNTTTRVFPHSGAIGIGGMYNDTFYHSGAANGDGNYFRGEILEVMITNESVDSNIISNIHNYMLGKWASEDLSKPNNLTLNNNSAIDRSASATWEAIDTNLMTTSYYEIAIGQTPGGTEDLFWLNIGNVLNYQVIHNVDGAVLNLSPGIDYYLSVRAIDTTGSPSQIATSDSWRIFDFNSEVQNVVLSLSTVDTNTIIDNTGASAEDVGFNGYLKNWLETSSSSVLHSISASSSSNEPLFSSLNQELVFDGLDDGLIIGNSTEINTQLLDQKNITILFKTSGDLSGKQVLYEEGGGTRGMNIYINNGKLYCGFWNDRDDGDGRQPFISMNGDVKSNTEYAVTWRFDYSNFTTATGEDGKLDCFLNGQFLGSSNTTTRIYPHSGGIGLGFANGASYYHDTGNDNSSSYNFSGSIKDVIINNTSMRNDAIQGLHNYLLSN